jgi:aspartate-semialdehyde dehydrogenase
VVGESLLTALEACRFPVETLHCLDTEGAAGGTLRFAGKSVPVQVLAGFDFCQVQLVFLCSEDPAALSVVDSAAECGCSVIDCSGRSGAKPGVPLMIPGVNPEALEGPLEPRIIANPSPLTIALLVVLKPLHDAVGIERVNVTLLEAVSSAGKAGVDELASQTVALLNMKEPQSRIFSRQIAFNVLPQIGPLLENGYTEEEMKLVWETQKILGESGININPTAVLVPVFYGHSLSVQLETRLSISADEVRTLLAAVNGVQLSDESPPTPVTEATKGDAVFVGRLREDISHPRGLALWITIDDVRRGAALNAVRIAELWEKCYT